MSWSIPGSNPIASLLASAAPFVPVEGEISVATQPGDGSPGSWALGPAVLSGGATRFVPFYSAFEAVEEIKRALDAGEAGKVYGCYVSFRIARGTAAEQLPIGALLPAVGVALDLLHEPVTRVWAQRASLFAANDAWFVHLRLADETLITIEALAALDPAAGAERDLLVEVTASERVLRAEPMRQSVWVEPLGSAAVAHGWWEDTAERFLRLVATRAGADGDEIARVRSVWSAIEESAASGQPVSL